MVVTLLKLGKISVEFDEEENPEWSAEEMWSHIVRLWCSDNPNLTSLPPLPPSLTYLYCSNNPNLTSLPPLPHSLTELYCSDNPNLTSLPPLPHSLTVLDCSDNPNLPFSTLEEWKLLQKERLM